MKKWIVLGLGTAFVIFQFQNCDSQSSGYSSKSSSPAGNTAPVKSGPDTGSTGASGAIQNSPDLNIADVDMIDFHFNDRDRSFDYSLDLETAQVINNLNQQTVCLTAQEKQTLSSIISKAQVCPAVTGSPDQICAEVYSPPYSQLTVSRAGVSLPLGEMTSSCSKGPDLCGGVNLDLKNFLAALESSLAQPNVNRSCN